MNRSRRIVAVSALAMMALIAMTGWSVLAGDGWPPERYEVYSMAGQWTSAENTNTLFRVGPEDQFGVGLAESIKLSFDPTVGGMIPTSVANTPVYQRYGRTGPNTWRLRGLMYFTDAAKPAPAILAIAVIDKTATMTAPGALEVTETVTMYLGSQDKDHDAVPDLGEKPIAVDQRGTSHWTPF